MIRFDILTLFPDMFKAVLGDSIINKAAEKHLLEMNFINIRDFSANKHKKVDDYPYSGGGGMLMTPQPIYDAYQSIVKDLDYKPFTIYMSPCGKVFDQKLAVNLSKENHIVIICGHYEGVDQRIIDMLADCEISLGDFVLTGGEIPAMAVIDSVARMIPGVLSSESSYQNESHYSGLLEHPQYTRPENFMGHKIPEILISGNHAKIDEWKRRQSIKTTFLKRPELLENAKLSPKERDYVRTLQQENDSN